MGSFVISDGASLEADIAAMVAAGGPLSDAITATTARSTGPSLYETGSGTEKAASLPVATSTGASVKTVLLSIPIGDLTVGQRFTFASEHELTNDLAFNVMVGAWVTLTNSPTSTAGIKVAEATATNITVNMHHGTVVKVGSYKATEPLSARYVNVVAYSASTAATAGDTVKVEQGYGRLSVVKF